MVFKGNRGPSILLAAAGLFAAGAIGATLAFYLYFLRDLPDLRSVRDYQPPLSSHVFDRNRVPIGEFYSERRRLTPLEEIPVHVIEAFVAGEDSSFFEHSGIDYVSILRAAWVNLLAGGEIRQGGSTITQQMVKGLLLSPERKFRRKIREMILARRIEERFTKEEILYLYLNQIYFGHGAYGIGEAARTYFGKAVADMSVSDGALLAGLPKAPSRYSPFSNPRVAEQRRRYVLARMREEEFIDEDAYIAAVAEKPTLQADPHSENFSAAAYFTEEVRRFLFDALGSEAVLRGGLDIETTLDLQLQRGAVDAVSSGLVAVDKRQGYRGPVRHVAADAISAELDRLELENGLRAEVPEEVEEELPEIGFEVTPAEGDELEVPGIEEQLAGAGLIDDGPLLGVVLRVDSEADVARIGFAPGLEGEVELSTVSWAREPDPTSGPRPVRAIDQIFQVGDVARFARVAQEPKEKEGPEASEDGLTDDADVVRVSLYQEPIVQGALLSIEVASGDVLALVGGYDFEKSQFDRVTQAKRQPGSAFKPIIYGAALAREYTAASIIHDRPVVYIDENTGFTWRPRNYGRSFYGPITMREALVRSVNNATVHLFRDLGVDYVIEYARRLGFESPLNRDLSLALGSSGVSLLEITRAYAVFPAGGRRVTPIFIRKVTGPDGAVLLENVPMGNAFREEPEEELAGFIDVVDGDEEAVALDPGQLITAEEAYLVTDLLRAVVVDPRGTGHRLRVLRRPVAGKTGTTNDQGDAWFLGFSPDIATGVWVGHDESRFLGWGETGSRAAAPIWVDYMRLALRDRPIRDFSVPEPIVFARIDRKTGLLADSSSSETVFQAFVSGTVPTESARTARATAEGRRLLRMDSF